jgi:hypothetical protein
VYIQPRDQRSISGWPAPQRVRQAEPTPPPPLILESSIWWGWGVGRGRGREATSLWTQPGHPAPQAGPRLQDGGLDLNLSLLGKI